MGGITVSHIGICVTDLEHSTRFYTEALGFRKTASYQVGDAFARLMEVASPMVLHTVMLEKDGFTLELLAYDSPDTLGPANRRPMNQLGFTHLSLRVEDVAAVGEKVGEFGGQIFEDTAYSNPEAGDFLYCTDPDGTRIELMRLNG